MGVQSKCTIVESRHGSLERPKMRPMVHERTEGIRWKEEIDQLSLAL
jgi:hypothetical protein